MCAQLFPRKGGRHPGVGHGSVALRPVGRRVVAGGGDPAGGAGGGVRVGRGRRLGVEVQDLGPLGGRLGPHPLGEVRGQQADVADAPTKSLGGGEGPGGVRPAARLAPVEPENGQKCAK